jgi:ketosteroid isomerase-like protein
MSPRSVDVIRGMYDAFAAGDVPSVLDAMDPRIEWREAEHFRYADRNPYRGQSDAVSGLFTRLAPEWRNWTLAIQELLDAGDTVVAFGRYRATHKETGETIDAQFAHVWRLRNGKVAVVQQYTDTAQVAAAMPGA